MEVGAAWIVEFSFLLLSSLFIQLGAYQPFVGQQSYRQFKSIRNRRDNARTLRSSTGDIQFLNTSLFLIEGPTVSSSGDLFFHTHLVPDESEQYDEQEFITELGLPEGVEKRQATIINKRNRVTEDEEDVFEEVDQFRFAFSMNEFQEALEKRNNLVALQVDSDTITSLQASSPSSSSSSSSTDITAVNWNELEYSYPSTQQLEFSPALVNMISNAISTINSSNSNGNGGRRIVKLEVTPEEFRAMVSMRKQQHDDDDDDDEVRDTITSTIKSTSALSLATQVGSNSNVISDTTEDTFIDNEILTSSIASSSSSYVSSSSSSLSSSPSSLLSSSTASSSSSLSSSSSSSSSVIKHVPRKYPQLKFTLEKYKGGLADDLCGSLIIFTASSIAFYFLDITVSRTTKIMCFIGSLIQEHILPQKYKHLLSPGCMLLTLMIWGILPIFQQQDNNNWNLIQFLDQNIVLLFRPRLYPKPQKSGSSKKIIDRTVRFRMIIKIFNHISIFIRKYYHARKAEFFSVCKYYQLKQQIMSAT